MATIRSLVSKYEYGFPFAEDWISPDGAALFFLKNNANDELRLGYLPTEEESIKIKEKQLQFMLQNINERN